MPNRQPLHSSIPIDLNWWGDGSTSFGIGIVLGTHWCAWHWAPNIRVGPHHKYNIGWAEAIAVELALLLALQLNLLASGTYLVCSNNSGVVAVLNKGCSRNQNTNEVLKRIYQLQAQSGAHLHATYVTSWDNIADALS